MAPLIIKSLTPDRQMPHLWRQRDVSTELAGQFQSLGSSRLKYRACQRREVLGSDQASSSSSRLASQSRRRQGEAAGSTSAARRRQREALATSTGARSRGFRSKPSTPPMFHVPLSRRRDLPASNLYKNEKDNPFILGCPVLESTVVAFDRTNVRVGFSDYA